MAFLLYRCDGNPADTPPKPGEIIEEAWCSSMIGDFSNDNGKKMTLKVCQEINIF
jgi:hypothetical protein